MLATRGVMSRSLSQLGLTSLISESPFEGEKADGGFVLCGSVQTRLWDAVCSQRDDGCGLPVESTLWFHEVESYSHAFDPMISPLVRCRHFEFFP